MGFVFVSPLKIVHASQSTLTYSSDETLTRGQIVAVPVGKTVVPAVVLGDTSKPAFATKPVERIIVHTPLPEPLLTLHAWLSDYYMAHPVQVWQTILPSGLLKKRRLVKPSEKSIPQRATTAFSLNSEQNMVVQTVLSRPHGTTLLHGVTGSGKTAVYIELVKQTIAAGRSAVVLIPEIALTSQMIAEFTPHFPSLLITHSTMTEAARFSVWQKALLSPEPVVVIGPRSALFMPVPQLGLIVIDECHEPAFKQEKNPRYSALRAAAVLAQSSNARLVLGSATPSVADYFIADHSAETAIVHMRHQARKDTLRPDVDIVDMTKKDHFRRSGFLSETLLLGIKQALEAGHQALLFHNRRGSAPVTLCENCAWSAMCEQCFVPLTLHGDRFELRCHVCGTRSRVPTSCPSCHAANIIHKGIGTKRIVEELTKLFPDAKIARFDGDNVETETVESSYQALYDGDIDIIVGTQVIAKGLDLPKLRFVGVVQADSGLALPDFSSPERVFQLLAQVAGRIGRNEHASKLVVQSYQPSHPSVRLGLAQKYEDFYPLEIAERQRGNYPPFRFLLLATCAYKTEKAAVANAQKLARVLRAAHISGLEILGPSPAFYERARDTYRWQLTLKSSRRSQLIEAARLIPPQHWQCELDPPSLLS